MTPTKRIAIRDWEKAARGRGWRDGPDRSVVHPDRKDIVYYAWRQCCIAEKIQPRAQYR